MKRAELWWATLPLPSGRRPVALVSRQAAYDVRMHVTVAEVSRTVRGIASEVPLGKRDGLPRACVSNTDNLATIPKAWLTECISRLRPEQAEALDEALAFSLGL